MKLLSMSSISIFRAFSFTNTLIINYFFPIFSSFIYQILNKYTRYLLEPPQKASTLRFLYPNRLFNENLKIRYIFYGFLNEGRIWIAAGGGVRQGLIAGSLRACARSSRHSYVACKPDVLKSFLSPFQCSAFYLISYCIMCTRTILLFYLTSETIGD